VPDGELPPNGLPAQIVEFWADIYTEAVRPMYPVVMIALATICILRFVWRRRQRRRTEPAIPTTLVAAGARDGPD